MKRALSVWVTVVAFAALLLSAAAPRAAAQESGIEGKILNFDGKPWADFAVHAEGDQGAKFDTRTDQNGHYIFNNLKSGTYKISVDLPLQTQPFLAAQVQVGGGKTATADLNLQEMIAKKNPEYVAEVKKQGEQKGKFQNMKQHFDAGVALLDQLKAKKEQLQAAPADQREALKQETTDLASKAVTEFEAAKLVAPEKDPNTNLILARLGDAYEAVGRSQDAVDAYQQAIALKPLAGYYNNMGGILGRMGKVDEATAAYQKSAELDPTNAAQAWRNFGITMYNANKYKEAIEPLQKAAQLDPKNAQTWYLLGTVLVGSMGFKKVGDKQEPDILPGTVEAYQHAIELDPSGQWGQQAKQGLDMLQQIAPGIETRINVRKKKS